MESLASVFTAFSSSENMTTIVSIAIAAVVFFYCLHLLRKNEAQQDSQEQASSEALGADLRRQA